jgi:hypothetical protein
LLKVAKFKKSREETFYKFKKFLMQGKITLKIFKKNQFKSFKTFKNIFNNLIKHETSHPLPKEFQILAKGMHIANIHRIHLAINLYNVI